MVKVNYKHVRRIKKVLASGEVKFYYRYRRANPEITLPGVPGSIEFAVAYDKAVKGIRDDQAIPGTMADLIDRYRASTKFKKLGEKTKPEYIRHLDALKVLGGDLPPDELTSADIYDMQEKMSDTPGAADVRVRVIKILYNWGKPRGLCKDNPAIGIEKINEPKSFEVWPDEVVETFLTESPPHIAAAIAVALYTGQRLGDCLKMTWSDIEDGAIRVVQGKTKRELWIPIHPELAEILETLPRNAVQILTSTTKKPWTADGFKTSFMKARAKLGLEEYTFHGLRHTAATRLADEGRNDADIMSITGHESTAMVRRYTKKADQKRRAKSTIAHLNFGTKRD